VIARRHGGLRIIDAGFMASVQDAGRSNVGHLGVSPSGYADWASARAANRLVGNPESAPLIETTMTGIAIGFDCAATVALGGADASLRIGGRAGRPWSAQHASAGESLVVGSPPTGLRCYLAVAGGIHVPPVFGSASTDLTARFGGLAGRRLTAGDGLEIDQNPFAPEKFTGNAQPLRDHIFKRPVELRILPGPSGSRLRDADMRAIVSAPYRVCLQSNRQGLRLEGAILMDGAGTDVVSAGLCAGCVQVLGDGLPVVLLAEHQTTGGYAVAACVISSDIPRAAQLRPGDELRFVWTTQSEAARALIGVQSLIRLAGGGG